MLDFLQFKVEILPHHEVYIAKLCKAKIDLDTAYSQLAHENERLIQIELT